MIIETPAGQLYTVAETGNPDLSHVWYGYPVKRERGEYVVSARGKAMQYRHSPELVRKAACRIVEA